MKDKHWALRFLLVCFLAFGLGIATGFIKSNIVRHTTPEPTELWDARSVVNEAESVEHRESVQFLCYRVHCAGDSIVLSEVFSDNSENIIETAQLNRSVLPKGDIQLLEEGITFEDKDEALMMIENFVS